VDNTGATFIQDVSLDGFGHVTSLASTTITTALIGAANAASPVFTGDVSIEDKIVHTGDTNTAIRFPAADTVTVETAGAERLRVTSAGRVGIGTSVPGSELDVFGVGDIIRSTANDGASNFMAFYDATGRKGYVGYGGATDDMTLANERSGFLRFLTNGSTRLHITSAGDVGIGTSSPSERLHVATVDGLSTSNALLRLGNTSAFNTLLLGYSGAGDVADEAPAIYATNTTGSTGQAGHIAYKARSGTARDHIFYTGTTPTERFRITSAGNVGIGTTTPATKLDVNGSASAVFFENPQTITSNYTIVTGRSAMNTGPITIDSGVTITVESGARYVVL
jgi:hypothetical protein